MKKSIMIASAAAAAALALGAALAFADTTQPQAPATFMMVNINRAGRANLEGTLASVSGNTLTLASWGGNWSIDISSAKLVRRFGGTAGISEFQTGDQLQVLGQVSASGAWAVTARTVRDMSIQERNANFSGTISNLDATAKSFTLTTKSRGDVKVTLASNGEVYVNRKQADFSALSNGISVRVSGVWDRQMQTVQANRIDYNQQRISANGAISNLSSTGFTLTTESGKAWQVTLATDAKIYLNNASASASDLQNGMTAQVRGYGDRNLSTVTANQVRAKTAKTPASENSSH